MKISACLASIALISMLSTAGFAQAPGAAPAAAHKKAISKACSDQADAQKLHGKERKTFRATCKKNGGKPG
jgi:hypothetical protein